MVLDNIQLNDMKLVQPFKNFSGAKNQNGRRDFTLSLDEQTYNSLVARGWPAKMKQIDDGTCYRNMRVNLGQFHPKIFQKSPTAMVELDDDGIAALDNVNIDHIDCDLQLVPYDYRGQKGVTAYLQSACVFIVPNRFQDMYDRYQAQQQASPADDNDDLPF